MIGDNVATDIGGAVASGRKSVWPRSRRRWPSHLDFVPTHVADTFAGVVSFVLGSECHQGPAHCCIAAARE